MQSMKQDLGELILQLVELRRQIESEQVLQSDWTTSWGSTQEVCRRSVKLASQATALRSAGELLLKLTRKSLQVWNANASKWNIIGPAAIRNDFVVNEKWTTSLRSWAEYISPNQRRNDTKAGEGGTEFAKLDPGAKKTGGNWLDFHQGTGT